MITGPILLQTVYTPFLLYLDFIPKDTWPMPPVLQKQHFWA